MPLRRIGMKNVSAVPHSPILETAVLPQTEGLLEAASQLIAY
jgi:hypothetical protein